MRVFQILGGVAVVAAACVFIFTDRGNEAMVLLVAGLGLVMADRYRARAPGGGGDGDPPIIK